MPHSSKSRPTNDKSQALRYLLLRYAWRMKNKIPESIYEEVANSINISNVYTD